MPNRKPAELVFNKTERVEVRCRSCGYLMGMRRRQGTFLLWCSDSCAESFNAKNEWDQPADEVALELLLSGQGVMDISRFLEMDYTRVQQILYRRGIDLSARAITNGA